MKRGEHDVTILPVDAWRALAGVVAAGALDTSATVGTRKCGASLERAAGFARAVVRQGRIMFTLHGGTTISPDEADVAGILSSSDHQNSLNR